MTILHFLVYYILTFLSLCIIYYYYEVPITSGYIAIIGTIILPFISLFISRFVKKENFQPKTLSLIGLFIFFLTFFMHILLSIGQDNYIAVAETDNIGQVHKIQTILSDEYIPVRITKDGSKYSVEVKYGKNALEYVPILIVENIEASEDVGIKIGVDYDDLETIEERLEKSLEKIIPHIAGVYSADVDLTISFTSFDKCCEPIKAEVSIVTDEGFILERIENTVANLLLSTVRGLTDENIHINTFVNKCTDDYKCGSEYYSLANKLYHEQKYQEALDMLEREQKIFPDKNKQSIKRLKDLIKFNKLISQNPNDYKLYIMRGDIKNVEEFTMFTTSSHGITSDYDGAISDYSQALKLNPHAYEVFARRGKAYTYRCTQKAIGYKCVNDPEDIKKGIEDLNTAIKYNMADDYAYEFIGDKYFYNKDYKSAIGYYEKISNETLFPIGNTLKIPKTDVTFRLFNRLPEEYNYLPLRMITCYKNLKQYDKAKKLCNKILESENDPVYIEYTKKIMKQMK